MSIINPLRPSDLRAARFNTGQFCMSWILIVFGSEQTAFLFCTALTDLVLMIEAESVYCAARAESLTVIQGEFRF